MVLAECYYKQEGMEKEIILFYEVNHIKISFR